MFVALITACTLGVEDPQPNVCKNFANQSAFFETEEACIEDILTVGVPFLESKGLYTQEANCVKISVFDEDA